MNRTRVANIIAWDNNAGLSRDIDILGAQLQRFGWTVRYNGRVKRAVPRRYLARVRERGKRELRSLAVRCGIRRLRFDLNLFLEDIAPAFLPLAAVNVLVPNPEWFRPTSAPYLPQIALVFAKTRDAVATFRDLGCTVVHMGFTSPDRSGGTPHQPKHAAAVHVAGKSMLKGTEVILDAWSRHPEWPQLTVVRARTDPLGSMLPWRSRVIPANVTLIETRLSDAELNTLLTSTRVHVATSEAEGFGHTIAEAMSVGAAVVTTDAPPMNELVMPDRGILVPVTGRQRMQKGWRHTISGVDLEATLTAVFQMDAAALNAIGARARAWYEANDAAFGARLQACIDVAMRGDEHLEGTPEGERALAFGYPLGDPFRASAGHPDPVHSLGTSIRAPGE